MLSFFRINDPYRIAALLLVLISIHLPVFIDPLPLTLPELRMMTLAERVSEGAILYDQLWDSTAPIATWIYALCFKVLGEHTTGYRILGMLLIFFQAAYFSVIIIKSRAFNENTYVAGIVYVLLFFFSPDTVTLSPLILAMPFLLLALDNLFGLLAFRLQRDETYLNTGVFLSVASLIDFSQIVFVIFSLLVLIILSRTGFRKLLLVLFGFLLPHAVLFAIYFFIGKSELLWQNYYLANLWPEFFQYINVTSLLYLSFFPLLFLLFSVFWLNRGGRLTNYQSQLSQVMMLWMIFGVIQISYGAEINPQALVILVPPFTFLISHYFLLIRRRKIAGIVFWFFAISVLGMNFLSKNNKLPAIQLQDLFVKENAFRETVNTKRILILGPDISTYQSARLGGAFFEWRLSENLFSDANRYDHVLYVNESLSRDLPEIIIDENNLLESFLQRLPQLKQKYVKRDNTYFLINN